MHSGGVCRGWRRQRCGDQVGRCERVNVQTQSDGLHLVEEYALVVALVAPVQQGAVWGTVQNALLGRSLATWIRKKK